MSAVVVAKFENLRDAEYVAELIKRLKSDARVISGRNWEDIYLAELIDEGMKDDAEISEKEFSTWLRKRIKASK